MDVVDGRVGAVVTGSETVATSSSVEADVVGRSGVDVAAGSEAGSMSSSTGVCVRPIATCGSWLVTSAHLPRTTANTAAMPRAMNNERGRRCSRLRVSIRPLVASSLLLIIATTRSAVQHVELECHRMSPVRTDPGRLDGVRRADGTSACATCGLDRRQAKRRRAHRRRRCIEACRPPGRPPPSGRGCRP